MAIPGNLLPANAESIETDASAWTALVNATGLARGTGGTLGSNCLLFKSVAAGDCQVGLAARVAVEAGTEYWSCSSVFAPASGAQSRLEVRWYNSGGTLISTTQGPLVTATGAVWHQVAALGVAPEGTTTANVVIRVTATAGTQSWFADRVYLGGVPATSAGNLLPFSAEGVEVDASDWAAESNCTLSIASSSYTWYQSLRITAVASGAAYVRSQLAPAVTPGVEYAGYCHVTPAQSGRTFRVAVLWRAADGSSLATSFSDWTPTTGGWTRCTVIDTAPVGAATARLTVSPIAGAAGDSWVCDRLGLAPTSALLSEGNLLSYNTSSFEQDVSDWTVTGGTSAQSRAQVLDGSYSMQMTADGGTMTASTVVPVGDVDGSNFEFVPLSFQSVDGNYRTQIEWLDATGAAIRTRWQEWNGRTTGWLGSSMGDLAPPEAVDVRLSFIVPDATVGDVWYLDRIAWGIGGLTVEATPSIAVSGARVTVRGLTAGGPDWRWSLERIAGGQAAQPVRGWTGDLTDQDVIGDIAVITDYEAPLGIPVQWRVSSRDPDGTGYFSYTSDPITLAAETTDVWLKDPGLPQRSAQITVGTPMPTWRTPARLGTSQVRGRRLPVVISDVRGGKTGDLTVITETAAEREALDWVLSSGSVLLLQWPPEWGEADMYVSIGDVSAAPLADYAEFHDRAWVLPLTEVDRPIGGVTGNADRTWQTVKDEGATWAGVLTGKSSWLDVYTGA
ncbi:hypothetical protein AB0E81_11415 [Streptomyces sp. NPDC033538]|uniref:hypothetical protein n=1 Tax=Streptomyces sp. NPDC033538 TaxID=3155367 RepID=UPI0033E5C580